MKMKKIVLFMVAAIPLLAPAKGARIGEPLPGWSEGCLDIHAINTARGECTFFVLPDGTTMAVDAGEFGGTISPRFSHNTRPTDSVMRPSHIQAEYMKHFAPQADSLDYFLLTHFHMDHMGQLEPWYSKSTEGEYVLSGMTALYHELPYRTVVDRAYPDYDSLAAQAMSTASLANYRKFLDCQLPNGHLKAEAFRLGADDQFVLRHKPAKYSKFKVSNICSNGFVWVDGQPMKCFDKQVRENGASCGILISYGDFDYLTTGDGGGDSKGSPNLGETIARAIGRPIEAMKAPHHLSPKNMKEASMEILRPDVIVTQSFYVREIQPDQAIIRRLIDNYGSRMFFTSIEPSLVEKYPEAYAGCASIGGHIVIRVMPGGKKYYVYTLDDSDLSYRVKKIDGPFKCK